MKLKLPIFRDTIRWDLFGKNILQQLINLLADLHSISSGTGFINSHYLQIDISVKESTTTGVLVLVFGLTSVIIFPI